MKNVRGYNFSRSFMGERVPQHVQNIVIKDFCIKNKLNFLLSATEYSMKNSSYILNELINNLDNLYGIVAYSIFQLPENEKKRKEMLKIIIKKKKKFFFACENLKVTNKSEMIKIEIIWKIRKTSDNFNYNQLYKFTK
jgi:sporadic carbohydrate cluster protein (TIGR04323 family)